MASPSRIQLIRENRSREHTLYRLYDAEDELLYVGISFMPDHRFEQHRREKHWWVEVDRRELETFPDRKSAEDAERKAIREENPVYNIIRPGFHATRCYSIGQQRDLRGMFFSAPTGQIGRVSGRLGGPDRIFTVETYQGEPLGPKVPQAEMAEWEFFTTRSEAFAEGL